MILNSDQIKKFETEGYLVVPDLMPTNICEQVNTEYTDLLNSLYEGWFSEGLVQTPGGELDFWEKLLSAYQAGCDYFHPMDISFPGDRIIADMPFHIGSAVFNMLTAVPLLDVVEQLIGPELTSNPIQHVRLKPPSVKLDLAEARAHITATDWHQDRAVALEDADQTDMVTVWLAMTDATVENGCLQVQPQTSGQTILPYCARTQTGIADGFLNESSAVPLPVKAGGAVLFHPLTPHASLTNVTDGFRWSFDIRFNASGQPTGWSHFPDFVVRSRAHPETELSDWRVCKAQWEEARARLAAVPHIDIHRWSADTPYCA